MTNGAAQPRTMSDSQQPTRNTACIGATRSAARAARARRCTLARLPAFHQDGADRHGEDAAAGCQDDKVVDHAFVPGPEAWDGPLQVLAIVLHLFRPECCSILDYLNRAKDDARVRRLSSARARSRLEPAVRPIPQRPARSLIRDVPPASAMLLSSGRCPRMPDAECLFRPIIAIMVR